MAKSAKIAKILIFLLTLTFVATVFCGCKGDDDVNKNPNVVFPQSYLGYAAEKSIFVVSIGQSSDAGILSYTLKQCEITHTNEFLGDAASVPNGSVVFIAVGCSMKGMAENETSKENELERAQTFVERKNRGEITLVAWHIGGVERRGSTSDSLIEYIFQNSDLVLFDAEGNFDYMLNHWAEQASVPYCQFTSLLIAVKSICRGDVNV